MQSAEHWEAKAVDEDVARAMGHAPASVAMLDIARLYRLRAEETREMEKAGAREALSRLRLRAGPASRPPQPVP
jgi:hypothetical protein